MSKWSKRISFVLVLILFFALLMNLFSKPSEDQTSTVDYSHIYDLKLDPVALDPKQDSYKSQSLPDDAYKYTSLWKIPEMYSKSSKDCLNNYLNFHPTVVVERDKLFEYYGIKIGTAAWRELVAAYEKQAINICYSYSGREIEDIYSSIIRESFTASELEQLLGFYKTDLGQKVIRVSNEASQKIQAVATDKQSVAVNNEVSHFYNETVTVHQQ